MMAQEFIKLKDDSFAPLIEKGEEILERS